MSLNRKGLLLSWLVLHSIAACGKPPSPAAAPLAIGQPAPDFSAHDQDGKPVRLSALRGKHVVLYFYPRDETPGCTAEAQAFRDSYQALTAKGAVIIGVSTDSDASHRDFAKNHQLPFTLVSDPEGELAGKYEVPLRMTFAARQSFVIAPDGTLKNIYRDVDPTRHAAEIAQDVK